VNPCTPTWEMKIKWTPKSSKGNCMGENSMAWGVPYIIRKLLECRCLKWACIAHLDIWNISYGQKKVESQIDNLTPCHWKSGIDLIYLSIDGMSHTIGKLSMRATTLLWTSSQLEVCSQSYGAPKLRESQFLTLLMFSIWNSHLSPSRSWECVMSITNIHMLKQR
jgi:hypothetical protein